MAVKNIKCLNDKCCNYFEDNGRKKYCSNRCSDNQKSINRSRKRKLQLFTLKCESCGKEYVQKHREQRTCSKICYNKIHAVSMSQKTRKKLSEFKKYINEYRAICGCSCCGLKNTDYPQLFDFHHVRGNKLFAISAGSSFFYGKRDIFDEEIEKCDVLCSNCHRLTHLMEYSSGISRKRILAVLKYLQSIS